jgi:hypothetical protein
MPDHTVSKEILMAAIAGFELEKLQLDAKIAEVRAMLEGSPAAPKEAPVPAAQPVQPKRKRSAAARRKMALAQKARWAKVKGKPEPAAKVKPAAAKPGRKLSEAGRAAIVEALKKRWALKKSEAKKASPAKKTNPA